jgi:undecaprenyl pyrophosphate phosphatase UppP
MLSYFQAAILGILQGISGLFPISSLGHGILLPAIFGWNNDQNALLLGCDPRALASFCNIRSPLDSLTRPK